MTSMTRILKSKCVIISIICIPFSQERVCKSDPCDENAPLVKKERVIAVKKDPDQSPPTLAVKPEQPVTLGTPVKMENVVTKMERLPTPQRRRAGVDNAQGWVS